VALFGTTAPLTSVDLRRFVRYKRFERADRRVDPFELDPQTAEHCVVGPAAVHGGHAGEEVTVAGGGVQVGNATWVPGVQWATIRAPGDGTPPVGISWGGR